MSQREPKRASSVAAVVLAAGGSQRLGEPKQLVPYQGKPLVRHVAEEVAACSCRWLGVVLGAHADEIAPALVGVRGSILSHEGWREGLASSLRRGVRWAASLPCEGLLVVLGDQLRVSTSHLERLLELFALGTCVVASRFDDAVGTPVLFPRASFGALDTLTGDRGARDLIKATRPRIEVGWDDGRDDLDTPADKARLAASPPAIPRARANPAVSHDRRAPPRFS